MSVSQGQGETLLSHPKKAMASGISTTASTDHWPFAMESSLLTHTQPDSCLVSTMTFAQLEANIVNTHHKDRLAFCHEPESANRSTAVAVARKESRPPRK